MALARSHYTQENNYSTEAQNCADVEKYLIPAGMAAHSALHVAGVGDGLRVSAARDTAEIRVSPGTALDSEGHVVVVAEGGVVVTDAPGGTAEEPHTLPVETEGVALPTTGHEPGDYRLTVSWREIEGRFEVMGTQQTGLLQAPWLRLVPAAESTGRQVVLAQLTLGTGGVVKSVVVGARRAAGVTAESLELRRPLQDDGATPSVGQVTAAGLSARPGGGVELDVVSADGSRQLALSVDGADKKLRVPAGVEVDSGPVDCAGGVRVSSAASGFDTGLQLRNTASGSRTYGMYAGADGGWHLADKDAASRDRLLVDQAGNVAIGSVRPERSLHVEGTEVHSGGSAGGFSFADRTASSGAFVESPGAGQRWIWYAQGGHARLWSGADHVVFGTGNEGDALDVPRRMRVRQGSDLSAGIWFRQNSGDVGFVGMQDNTHVGFWGSGADWGLSMDTTNGKVGTSSLATGSLSAWRVDTEYVNAVSSPGYRAGTVVGGLVVEGHTNNTALSLLGAVDMKNHPGTGFTALNLTQQTPGRIALDVNGGPIIVRKAEGSSYSLWAAQAVYSNQALVSRDHRVTVDHPLDPVNKTLSHTAVQAPEMTTQYDGTVVTDERGEATVYLPAYTEAFSGDFRYQLTPIADRPVVATVVRELEEGSFTLRTDAPATKVCWQVSGKRHDAWARKNRLVAEADKPGEEQRPGEFAALPASTSLPATTPDMRGH